MRQMAASAFKAKCLSLIRQAGATGESVAITHRGKVIAKLVPAELENDDIFGFMQRKGMRIVGDITAPIPVEWKVMKMTKKKK
jgi:antitoxin (DNA-binding transcriptional repressor) of toxin-antitoxin stability system